MTRVNLPVKKKLVAISELIRLTKQYGTLLVLWPTLWSLFIASSGKPPIKLLVIFIAGTFLMRSAGCAINDIADRGFDRHVERTRARPLACGALTVKEALLVFALLCSLSLLLVLELNLLTIGLAFAGVALAVVYPFVKRVSHFPQTVLGIAFGWGAVMAWSAVKGTVGVVPLLIFFANICWSMAYDTLYALVDRDDDLKIGVKSTAIYFGERVYTAVTAMYFGVAAFLLTAGVFAGLGALYYVGVASALLIFLFIVRAVRGKKSREAAFNGFLQNAAVGAMLLLFVILDLNFNGVIH